MRAFVVRLAALLLIPLVAAGHHSWARYDGDNVFTITGTVTKVEWASPQVFMYFDAVDNDGTVNRVSSRV
jgi:hypothetical protein